MNARSSYVHRLQAIDRPLVCSATACYWLQLFRLECGLGTTIATCSVSRAACIYCILDMQRLGMCTNMAFWHTQCNKTSYKIHTRSTP